MDRTHVTFRTNPTFIKYRKFFAVEEEKPSRIYFLKPDKTFSKITKRRERKSRSTFWE
jgi:hypothetical protein